MSYQEIERKLLAKICLEGNREYILNPSLAPDEKFFVSSSSKKIWHYIQQCVLSNGSVPSIQAVFEAIDEVLPFENVDLSIDEYIHSLKEEYKKRIALKAAKQCELLGNKYDFDTLCNQLQNTILELNDTRVEAITNLRDGVIRQKIQDDFDRRAMGEDEDLGIKTPWFELTQATGGIKNGCLWTIVGDSGVGKTFCLCLFAEYVAKQNKRIMFVSMEMTEQEIQERIVAIGAGISIREFRDGTLGNTNPDDVQKLHDYLTQEWETREGFFILSSVHLEYMQQIEFYIQHLSPDIVFIDSVYDLRVKGNFRSEYEAIAESCRYMRHIVQKYDIPIVVTTQFQRGGRGKQEIGYSIRFLQDSSLVLGIYKDKEVEKKMQLSGEGTGYMKFVTLKNRFGPTVAFITRWDLSKMDFEFVGICDE